MMRCFIAINPGERLREEIHRATARLREAGADVKWVDRMNLHITLKFLGETSEETAFKIAEKLGVLNKTHNAFIIRLSGVGAFPDWKRPRIIWIGTDKPEYLTKLQESVEEIASTFGYNRENREFSSHLTIGRVRSLKNIAELARAADETKDRVFGNIIADRVSLMKSELKTTGAEYRVLRDFELKEEQ